MIRWRVGPCINRYGGRLWTLQRLQLGGKGSRNTPRNHPERAEYKIPTEPKEARLIQEVGEVPMCSKTNFTGITILETGDYTTAVTIGCL